MFESVSNPTDCKIRAVIQFLNITNIKQQISKVNGEKAMSDGMVRKWV